MIRHNLANSLSLHCARWVFFGVHNWVLLSCTPTTNVADYNPSISLTTCLNPSY